MRNGAVDRNRLGGGVDSEPKAAGLKGETACWRQLDIPPDRLVSQALQDASDLVTNLEAKRQQQVG